MSLKRLAGWARLSNTMPSAGKLSYASITCGRFLQHDLFLSAMEVDGNASFSKWLRPHSGAVMLISDFARAELSCLLRYVRSRHVNLPSVGSRAVVLS